MRKQEKVRKGRKEKKQKGKTKTRAKLTIKIMIRISNKELMGQDPNQISSLTTT